MLALGLSSCVLLEGPTPETPDRTAQASPGSTGNPAETDAPEGSAQARLADFTGALDAFANGTASVAGESMVNALIDAGFDRQAMQVSFDTTQTNLVADSIFVSVRIDESCLLGQVVTETRELATSIAPAIGPDKNICLIGKTRQIDW